MKLKLCLFIFLIFFSFTSCSQHTISNNYYSKMNSTKNFTISVDINENNKNLTVNETTFEISNINTASAELQKIQEDSQSNKDFIESLNQKIINTLDNIGFNEEIIYNHDQKTKDNNLLFTKRSEYQTSETKTILLTTTYSNSNNEFNVKNISMMFEILRLFEYFDKEYHLSVLFINNSLNLNNSIDYAINDILHLNILSIIDIQFENTLNKVNLLKLDSSNKLSTFLENSIKHNSFNFINISEVVNKNNFKNISSNNIDFVRIVSETNASDLTKCSNFIITVLSDILNKPTIPSISVNDSIIRITLNLENHDTAKQILYKINDEEYLEVTKNSSISFNESINLSIKVVDLFDNESDELKIRLF